MTLNELKIGQSGIITRVGGEQTLRQHFLDMGVIDTAEVTVVKFAPMGDPMELKIRGYELTMRLDDAKKIEVTLVEEKKKKEEEADEKKRLSLLEKRRQSSERAAQSVHPGLGEGGKYHDKSEANPLPKDVTLTFALVGNQNCGKTTLFNQLTGSNQHVGNFPGVTVDSKTGAIKGYPNTQITDLPGIYSMSPYSPEEIVSRNFVLDTKPNAIINIVDATNIERNLYLTMQLLEMDIPMVIALNMMDEVTLNSGWIDINLMEEMLGVPVVAISAAKNEGVDELVWHALHVAHNCEKPQKKDFCNKESADGGAVHRSIHACVHLIEDHAKENGLPVRFAASKLLEGDKLIEEKLSLDDNEGEMLEHIRVQMESERGLDCPAAIADMRFSYIQNVCSKTVVKPKESKEYTRSQKIDKILTGKYTAIPCFIVIMILVFFLTFNVIGKFLQDLLAMGIDSLAGVVDGALSAANVNAALHSLIIDGIFQGVGSVLSFLPIIVVLFLFLSLLEDSGYIARVAFVMDKLLRKIGLSGRSIVPLLIGFGCTVPAVMSTRTLPSERDRKMTVLLTPFMSCSAKLPVYSFFVNAFFPGKGGLVMAGVYFVGILLGILMALVFKSTLFKGNAVPFCMELPNYRLPGVKNVAQLLWEKAKDFLQKAFTVIFVATVIIWFLESFDTHFNFTTDSSVSILSKVAGFIAPIFKPLGLDDWRICTSLISGFVAKETVASSLGVLFGTTFATAISVPAMFALLAFSLLYTPCVAAVNAIRRELGVGYAIGVVVWQCVLAYVVALLVKLLVGVIV